MFSINVKIYITMNAKDQTNKQTNNQIYTVRLVDISIDSLTIFVILLANRFILRL